MGARLEVGALHQQRRGDEIVECRWYLLLRELMVRTGAPRLHFSKAPHLYVTAALMMRNAQLMHAAISLEAHCTCLPRALALSLVAALAIVSCCTRQGVGW